MQVSFHGEVEDHVVIGGGVAQACGIEDTAEFLDMLSDTIYREKALAAVREPICNAWDAHIAAGKTDIPLVITLGDGKLTIQDFGPGIAPDKMHGIYCVYGRSTKKTDEAQTGGFGIGSKAPWAYSKHFTVTSAYNGTRTIYAMSKGSVENNGKPDMRPITSVPCDQSGLSVTIPIKKGDELKFENLVRSVVINGGIRAALNGELLPYREYEAGRKMGFVMVEDSLKDGFLGGQVGVLVGTVLYPLETENIQIRNKLNILAGIVPAGLRLVLLAEPNTISIAPSRESLSYGDRTIEAVNDLLDKAIATSKQLKADRASIRKVIEKGVQIRDATRVEFNMPQLSELLGEGAWARNVLADRGSISLAMSRDSVAREVYNQEIRNADMTRYAFQHLRRIDQSRADFWKMKLLQKAKKCSFWSIEEELFAYTVKRIAKKAAKLGLSKEISLFSRSFFRRMDIRYSMDRDWNPLFERFLKTSCRSKYVFVLSHRAGVARDWIAENTHTFERKAVIPLLIIDRDKVEEGRLFAKFMQDIGFQVSDLLDVKPEKKVRVPKVEQPKKDLFYKTTDLSDLVPAQNAYVGTPKHYIHIKQQSGGINVSWKATYRICELIAEIVPNTCVIYTAEALKQAKKLGMTSAVEIALEKVQKAIEEDGPAMFEFLRDNVRVVTGPSRYVSSSYNCIRGLNNLIWSFPFAASVLSGKRNAHKVSEKDKAVGRLIVELVKLNQHYEVKFYGYDSEQNDRVKKAGSNVNFHESRHRIDGDDLIKRYPALLLANFQTITGSLKDELSEKTVQTIIRAFMKA